MEHPSLLVAGQALARCHASDSDKRIKFFVDRLKLLVVRRILHLLLSLVLSFEAFSFLF